MTYPWCYNVTITVARSRSGAMAHVADLYDIHSGKTYHGLRSIEYPDGVGGLIIDAVKAKSITKHPR